MVGVLMTQYTEKVAEVLRRQQVEKWAKGVEYIAGQYGYIETALNDGSVTREYHRASPCGKYQLGDKVFLQEAKSIDELMDLAPRDI
jgi:hypothetical protein